MRADIDTTVGFSSPFTSSELFFFLINDSVLKDVERTADQHLLYGWKSAP